jgi:hypothetical protein
MRSGPAAPAGGRTLRLVNLLLTLCLALMLARLYQKAYASGALEPAGRASGGAHAGGPAPPPPAAGPAGAPPASALSGFALEADAEGLPRMWKQRAYHPSKAVAATGVHAGPPALAPLAGRCFYFVVPDRSLKVEWCPDDHVQQVRMPVYSSVDSGWYAGWHKDAAGRFVHQRFEGGETCGAGFDFPRTTQVHLVCKPDARGTLYSAMSQGVDLVEFKEVDVCKYSLTVGLKEWCDVEREQGVPS